MNSLSDLMTSTLASGLRAWQGIAANPDALQPPQLLQLYDIENCPYCRLVREVFTELSLDAHILPCPKGGQRFRSELETRAGKQQFPYLIDPNTGVEMYESLAIVQYLFETYGGGRLPLQWRLGRLQTLSSSLASAARLKPGAIAQPANLPEQMLELYSFEASPFARPVRELLCQLEIPYVLRSCGRSELAEWLPPPLRDRLDIAPNSRLPNRIGLLEREGRMGIPYLYDPNTEQGLFESAEIMSYLRSEYA